VENRKNDIAELQREKRFCEIEKRYCLEVKEGNVKETKEEGEEMGTAGAVPMREKWNYWATALTKAWPLGVPTPVTLSQPTAVVSELSVPKVKTSQRVEDGLLKSAP
jgi:hypothetical protein